MYSKELEELIDAALADGVLTEKEKQILIRKAKAQGIDLDEFEMVLNARALKAQHTQQSACPAKEKKGNIITCPNCGAHVSALSGVCPECGHEFTNVGAISSAQNLAKKIEQIIHSNKDTTAKKWDKMADVINTFPIPNAKADLFEFVVTMRVKMQDVVHNPAHVSSWDWDDEENRKAGARLMTAYMNKYKECVTKINILFPNDPTFIEILSSYHEDIKIAQKAIKHQRAKKADKVLIGIVIISIIVIGLHVWFYVDDDFEWWESMLWGGGTIVGGYILANLVALAD